MRYEEIYLSEVSFVGGLYSLFLAILILENDSRPTTTYMSFREGERETERERRNRNLSFYFSWVRKKNRMRSGIYRSPPHLLPLNLKPLTLAHTDSETFVGSFLPLRR